jgi:hypothetical protein
MNTPVPEAVFDFVGRRYAAELEEARFHLECARKYAGGEHSFYNALMHLHNAMNIRVSLDVMRGNG